MEKIHYRLLFIVIAQNSLDLLISLTQNSLISLFSLV